MQADQVIWLIVGAISVLALWFLMRLFRMPQDERLAFPSTAAEQPPTPSARGPRIRSKKDLIAFLEQETGDHELALLLADVAERIGRDGHIDVRQGGSGTPYAVEYSERPDELARLKRALESAAADDERHRLERQITWLAGLDQRSCQDIRAELDTYKEALKTAAADDERDRLERQIAWLAGGVGTLWINVTPSADYERRRNLVRESFGKLKSAVAG